jgi:hypothetical protein
MTINNLTVKNATAKRNVWRMVQALVITLMVLATVNSLWELNAKAYTTKRAPNCSGLVCYSGADCGSECFCNKTDGSCYPVYEKSAQPAK